MTRQSMSHLAAQVFSLAFLLAGPALADAPASALPAPSGASSPSWAAPFSQVRFEPGFESFFHANPFLMEAGGAKIVRFPGGTNLVVGVGMTDVRPSSPKEILRRKTVARNKALSALAGEIHGFRVYSSTKTIDETTVSIVNGEETGLSVEKSIVYDESEVKGWLPGLKVIGTWMTGEEGQRLYYVAVGGLVPSKR